MRSAGVLPVIQQEAGVAHTSQAISVHHVLQVIESLPVGHSAHNVIRVEMYAHSEWRKVQNQILLSLKYIKTKILPLKKYSIGLYYIFNFSLKQMYSKLTSVMPIPFDTFS